MGGVGSKAYKPLKNWNIESRAQKIISREKPVPAPTYESTQKQIELVNKLEPDYKVQAQKKDQQLDDYLKKVYVNSNSTEVQEIGQKNDPDRPLPKDRLLPQGFEYGFYESSEIPPGRVSLRQAIEFLSNHKKEPEKYTVEFIATQYKLDQEVVKNILSFYNLFTVYDTKEDYSQDIILSHMPISQRTGIQVRFSKDMRSKQEKIAEKAQQFITRSKEPMPVEEEKKRLE